MLIRESLARFLSGTSSNSIACLILVMPLVLSLAGCTGEGAGGPVISSLSTPTDAPTELDSDQASDSEEADHDHDGGGEDPIITMTSTTTGVTAHVTWTRPSDIDVTGYAIYYGKHSEDTASSDESPSEDAGAAEIETEEPNSCSRGESQTVESPSATITGLEPDTSYFFAIRAFNESESESLCSNEIIAVTPSAQS
ncbi:MAG: hypothetical protein CV089_23435 [Nitrospira sp. WS110]|nr:hypothetical protein [Nitrospira sp. WS110]